MPAPAREQALASAGDGDRRTLLGLGLAGLAACVIPGRPARAPPTTASWRPTGAS